MLQLELMLAMLDDTSANQKRTHVDDALDMLVPLLPVLTTPMGKALVERTVGALDRAGIRVL